MTPARARWAAAVLATAAAVLVSGCGSQGAVSAPAHTSPRHAAARAAEVAVVRPVSVRLPAIGVSSTLVSLGLNADRTVEVPKNPLRVGWYRLGAVPGESGSAVLLGHVDSDAGPAVFARLKELEPGALVVVRRSDGSRATFRVTRTVTYPNADFPRRQVYADHGRVALTLVTCGGAYDHSRGGYQSNVVVSTTFVGVAPA